MAESERRHHMRIKTAAQVEVLAGLNGKEWPRTLKGSCLDISVDGAMLVLGEPLEEGDEVFVTLKFYSELVECAAVTVRAGRSAETGRWRMGCQFKGVSEKTHSILARFVSQRLDPRLLADQ